MDIERLDLHDMGGGFSEIGPCANGDYVWYSDIEYLIQELDDALAKLAAMEAEISSLPAKWSEDSSLKTWFPLTSDELESMREELAELRAYKETMENQPPVGFVYEDDSWCGGGEIHAQVDVDLPPGTKLYANPVPAYKPADKRVNRDDLRLDLDRGHLLNEAADRADYFFRQTDGSYKFPSLGGHVSQLIEMLLAAANLPADKPAVVVPDCFAKLYEHARGMRFGTDWNNGTAAHHNRQPLIDATWECEKWLSAAPSHSQQSADIDGFVSYLRERYQMNVSEQKDEYLNLSGYPSHESEQGGEV